MRTATFLCFIILTTMIGCITRDSEERGFTINAEITGLDDGIAVLKYLELGSNKGVTRDTAIINNGRFTFTGQLHSPYIHSITLNDSVGSIYLFLENSAINIKGDVNHLDSIRVTGSKEDSIFREYFPAIPFDIEAGSELLSKYPNQVISAWVAYYLFPKHNYSQSKMDSVMSSFSHEVRQSIYYMHLDTLYQTWSSVKTKSKAPDFELFNYENQKIGLDDFDGRWVFLNFTIDGYPVDDFLTNIHDEFETELEIINISVSGSETTKEFNSETKPWVSLQTNSNWRDIADIYGVKFVPQYFLIDPKGIIIGKNMEYNTLIDSLSSSIRKKRQ